MRVTLLAVGRVKGELANAVLDYETRARRYWKMDVIEVVAGLKGRAGRDADRVRAAEGERLLARVPTRSEVVALTRSGRSMSSRELAGFLEERALASSPGVVFIIGGAFGLGQGVLSRARIHLSLSTMTLPHELARLFMAEQLYRAGTILKGEPYHKQP